jgi:hypothetical protein
VSSLASRSASATMNVSMRASVAARSPASVSFWSAKARTLS